MVLEYGMSILQREKMNKYTKNNFKKKVDNMNEGDRQILLEQLQNDLMYWTTRKFQTDNTMTLKNLKHQIRYLKSKG
jgi:hypothetical protein